MHGLWHAWTKARSHPVCRAFPWTIVCTFATASCTVPAPACPQQQQASQPSGSQRAINKQLGASSTGTAVFPCARTSCTNRSVPTCTSRSVPICTFGLPRAEQPCNKPPAGLLPCPASRSVMDYASGGSLFSYVQQRQRLKEPLARWFFQQLLLAVDYCHRKVRAPSVVPGWVLTCLPRFEATRRFVSLLPTSASNIAPPCFCHHHCIFLHTMQTA